MLCIFTRIRILNVRILGDSFGIFTCQKSTGASEVDYMIAPEEFKILFISMCINSSLCFQIAMVKFQLVLKLLLNIDVVH